jgi:hypothetical protein
MVALNFRSAGIDPTLGFEVLPAGWYPSRIVKSEQKPTNANDGYYLQLEHEILDGPHRGKVVVNRLNLWNQNQSAVEMANKTMAAICHVTGVHDVQDSAQLHGIPFMINVAVVPRKDAPGQNSNNVIGYKDMQGNEPGKGQHAGPAMAPQQPQAQQGGFPGQPPQPQPQPQPQPGQPWGAGAQPQPAAPPQGFPQQPAPQPAPQPQWQPGAPPPQAAPQPQWQGGAPGAAPAPAPAPQPAWTPPQQGQPAPQGQPAAAPQWQQGGQPAGPAPWGAR